MHQAAFGVDRSAVSCTTLTPPEALVAEVMSASVLLPPSTRLEIGQETNCRFGSTSVTATPATTCAGASPRSRRRIRRR